MAMEIVNEKSAKGALKIFSNVVAETLDDLLPFKMHCSVLAEEALESAIKDYLSKQK